MRMGNFIAPERHHWFPIGTHEYGGYPRVYAHTGVHVLVGKGGIVVQNDAPNRDVRPFIRLRGGVSDDT